MQMSYSDFDVQFSAYFAAIWRFCFFASGDKAAADDLTFRAFLYLGAAKDEQVEKEGADRLLFAAACTLAEDYYLRKMRHRPKRARLEAMGLSFAVTDGVWAFLCLPLDTRLAWLLEDTGFDEAQRAAILRKSMRRVRSLCKKAPAGDWRAAIRSVVPDAGADDIMRDKIYIRFAERSVAVENQIHGLRYAFNRAAPWLGAAILLLFAFAYWYVEHI